MVLHAGVCRRKAPPLLDQESFSPSRCPGPRQVSPPWLGARPRLPARLPRAATRVDAGLAAGSSRGHPGWLTARRRRKKPKHGRPRTRPAVGAKGGASRNGRAPARGETALEGRGPGPRSPSNASPQSRRLSASGSWRGSRGSQGRLGQATPRAAGRGLVSRSLSPGRRLGP